MIKSKKSFKIGAYIGIMLLAFCAMFLGLWGANTIDAVHAEDPITADYTLIYRGPSYEQLGTEAATGDWEWDEDDEDY
ncbi:MAG: hypothetical protein PHS54_04980, partial [Clostridia bacterium]|nr:hypothetical protein [Clostridia bacterium]